MLRPIPRLNWLIRPDGRPKREVSETPPSRSYSVLEIEYPTKTRVKTEPGTGMPTCVLTPSTFRRPLANEKNRSLELKSDTVPLIRERAIAGSVYRSTRLFWNRPKSQRKLPDFACPKRFGLVISDEARQPGIAPHRGSKVDGAGLALLDREGDVDVSGYRVGLDFRNRKRGFKEPQSRDRLIAPHQPVLRVNVPREKLDPLPDHPVVRVVVAFDKDSSDIRELPFGNDPPEGDRRLLAL